MIIANKIRDENLQCNINREEGKKSTSLAEKKDEYEYLTGEETSDQSKMIK